MNVLKVITVVEILLFFASFKVSVAFAILLGLYLLAARIRHEATNVAFLGQVQALEKSIRGLLAVTAEKEEVEELLKKLETPQKFINHAGYIIEDYGGYYIVFDPTKKERWHKLYHDVNKAINDINQKLG
jgi:hypothetical protein